MLTVSDIHGDIIPAVVEQEWWSASITAFDDGDYEQAAALSRKLGNKARAIYNVAICYLLMGDDDSARITFERATKADPFFCIAHFHVAHIYHQLEDFERALSHYEEARRSLRDNSSIEYAQLGLETTIYACEIEFNLAALRSACLDRGAALRSLVSAHQSKVLSRHDVIDQMMTSNMEAEWTLFAPPDNLIFRPKPKQQSLSIGALRVADRCTNRELLGLAQGEVDDNTKFMAPIHRHALEEEMEKIQRLNHSRKHSRSSSVVTASGPAFGFEAQNLAKLRLMGSSGEVIQSRMISLENIFSFHHLSEKVNEKFALEKIQLKFQDEEGDLITICDDSDLAAAYSTSSNSLANVKLTLWCYPY